MAKKDTLIIAFYWGVGSQEQGFHGSFLCRNYACQAGAASIAPVLTKLPVVPPVLGTDPTASPMGPPCAHRPRARGRPQPSDPVCLLPFPTQPDWGGEPARTRLLSAGRSLPIFSWVYPLLADCLKTFLSFPHSSLPPRFTPWIRRVHQ